MNPKKLGILILGLILIITFLFNSKISKKIKLLMGQNKEIGFLTEELISQGGAQIGQQLGQDIGTERAGSPAVEIISEDINEGTAFCGKTQNLTPQRKKVILNEIAWMGGSASPNDEWIELKNISGQEVNLSKWQFLDKDRQIKIIFNNGSPAYLISPNETFLLERTNDDSASGTTADLIYNGELNNNNEAVYLFDENCLLQDEILTESGWPAGDNATKQTMERKGDLTWQTSLNAGGTPKAENSSGYVLSSPAESPSPSFPGLPSPSPTPENQITYPKIMISEIQVSPIEKRFVELYNPNESAVNLTGWYIQRKTEGAASWDSFITSTQFKNKIIQPKGYFLISREIENSDILLGSLTISGGNSIILKNPAGEIVDNVGFGLAADFEGAPAVSPSAGQSISRKWSDVSQTEIDTDNNYNDFIVQTATPKAKNIIYESNPVVSPSPTPSETPVPASPTPTPFPSPSPNPSPTPASSILISEIQIAGISNINDEFIELYNPGNQEVDLSLWSIQKSYSTSTTIYKKNFEAGSKIPAKGYFLVVNASSTDENLLNLAGMTHKTFSLAENNTIYLATNQEKIESVFDSDIIDAVGFGANVFAETNPFQNPQEGQSIGRKWSIENYIDTDDNSVDFEIQAPNPKEKNG